MNKLEEKNIELNMHCHHNKYNELRSEIILIGEFRRKQEKKH